MPALHGWLDCRGGPVQDLHKPLAEFHLGKHRIERDDLVAGDADHRRHLEEQGVGAAALVDLGFRIEVPRLDQFAKHRMDVACQEIQSHGSLQPAGRTMMTMRVAGW